MQYLQYSMDFFSFSHKMLAFSDFSWTDFRPCSLVSGPNFSTYFRKDGGVSHPPTPPLMCAPGSGCQHYLDRFTWRHDSILKFLARTFQAVSNCKLLVDLPGFESPSIITGDDYRPDLLITTSDKRLYIVELTVGYESNLENNVNRKKTKYKDLIKQLDTNFSTVKFVNLSMMICLLT